MNVTICWTTKEWKVIEKIRKKFGISSYMSVNRETPCNIKEEDMELLRETEKRGFIEINKIMLVGTTNLNTTLNLTYVLTDVVETLLYDLRSEMGKQGYELRHDAKRNFNTAIAAIRKLKQDVDKTQFSTQENFGNDSDCLLAFIRLLVDRCGDDDKKMFAFYNYIKRHPSQLGLDLSDEKSTFAHIFESNEKLD